MDSGDKFGRTPLMFCVLGDRIECAELLIKAGTDVNRKDIGGRTALHWAAHKVEMKLELCLTELQCPDLKLYQKMYPFVRDYGNRITMKLYPCHDSINILSPRQDGRHFPDDIFKWIFLNEIICISIKISLKFVPSGPINNIPTLVQIMAWHRPGDKPLSDPMMVSLLTHKCVTRPQWVKKTFLDLW